MWARGLWRLAPLAASVLFFGCAQYSGSKMETSAAVARSRVVVVGKILSAEIKALPENSFFREVESRVKVVQSIRGVTPSEIKVSYMLQGDGGPPFHAGELCVFCIPGISKAEPGIYHVLKPLPATPDNIAAVERDSRA